MTTDRTISGSVQVALVPVLLEPLLAAILAAWRASDWTGEVTLRFVPGGTITHVQEKRGPLAVSSAMAAPGGEIRFGKVEVTWQNYVPHVVYETRTTKLRDEEPQPM